MGSVIRSTDWSVEQVSTLTSESWELLSNAFCTELTGGDFKVSQKFVRLFARGTVDVSLHEVLLCLQTEAWRCFCLFSRCWWVTCVLLTSPSLCVLVSRLLFPVCGGTSRDLQRVTSACCFGQFCVSASAHFWLVSLKLEWPLALTFSCCTTREFTFH